MFLHSSHIRLSAAFVLVTALLPAQKKPVTLESLQEGGMRGGGAMFAPGRVWHPQGGRFVWIEGSKLMQWSTDSPEAKESSPSIRWKDWPSPPSAPRLPPGRTGACRTSAFNGPPTANGCCFC